MLGNILFQILMFIIIWDIYLRIGGQNTNLKNRIRPHWLKINYQRFYPFIMSI